MDSPSTDPDLLHFAADLAARAGTLVAERFYRADRTIALKPDRTEVTDADLAVENLIRSELNREFPGAGFYGEETGSTKGTSGRRWIVDPIDGTRYFTHRVPIFGVNLAYEDEYGPAIGVRHQPVSRHLIHAGRGLGCHIRTGDAEVPPILRATPTLAEAGVEMVNFDRWPTDLVATLHRSTGASGYVFGVGALRTGLTDAIVITGTGRHHDALVAANR